MIFFNFVYACIIISKIHLKCIPLGRVLRDIGGTANTLWIRICKFLWKRLKVLAVPPIAGGLLLRIWTYTPEGVGGAANTLGALYTYFLFHTRGYWRCRQYPGGALYTLFLFHIRGYWRCRQYLGGPIICISIVKHEGIGGAANIPGPLKRICTFIPDGYWRCR